MTPRAARWLGTVVACAAVAGPLPIGLAVVVVSARPGLFARAIGLVGADANVDAVVVIYIPVMVSRPDEIAAAIASGAGRVPHEKPVLTVFRSTLPFCAIIALAVLLITYVPAMTLWLAR